MFGRRTAGFGNRTSDVSAPPPPTRPPIDYWEPEEKMVKALQAAICLFCDALKEAGYDCGKLTLDGPSGTKVAPLLADCITYAGRDGREFLALGRSRDFRTFSFEPHFRLFRILNAALILEDLPTSPFRSEIAVSEVPRQLVEAHLMLRWVRFIRPIGKAYGGPEAELGAIIHALQNALVEVGQNAPDWLAQRISIKECVQEWGSAFPATLGKPLTSETPRINDLPMTENIEQAVTNFLVETQMQGLAQKHGQG